MNKRYLTNDVFRELFTQGWARFPSEAPSSTVRARNTGAAAESRREPMDSGIVIRGDEAANDALNHTLDAHELVLEVTVVRSREELVTLRDEETTLRLIDEGWPEGVRS